MNQQIPISGITSGIINNIATAENVKYLISDIKPVKLNQYFDGAYRPPHALDIKRTNILGKKALSRYTTIKSNFW